jgi:hypothetical protein
MTDTTILLIATACFQTFGIYHISGPRVAGQYALFIGVALAAASLLFMAYGVKG